jgi:hypothetical protein
VNKVRFCRRAFKLLIVSSQVARTHFWSEERARSVLRYRPVVSREEGLRRMYAHFESLLLAQGYPRRYQIARKRALFAAAVLLVACVLKLA